MADKLMICRQTEYFQFQFYVIQVRGLVDNYINVNRQKADIILQLQYYNSMFRPFSTHLQKLHSNYMHETEILCK